MSRGVILDNGSLNRERPETRALMFPSCTRESFVVVVVVVVSPYLYWNGECEKDCIQRDTMTGMVAGYHQSNDWHGQIYKTIWCYSMHFDILCGSVHHMFIYPSQNMICPIVRMLLTIPL